MKHSFVLGLAVVLGGTVAACSTTESSTSATLPTTPAGSTTATTATTVDAAAGTTTVAAVTTPTAPSSTAVSTSPPPTAAPTTATPTVPPPPTPTDQVTHVYVTSRTDFGGVWQRVGAWDGSAWLDLDAEAAFDDPIVTEVSITSVDLPSVEIGPYSLEPWGCVDADVHNGASPDFVLPILPDDPGGLYRQQAIAVTSTWRLQPRPVTAIGLGADIYQTVGESLLAGSGVDPSVGDVVQVFRVDLDGNGTEEVLVTFERITAPFGADGDLSLVYARSVAGAGVDDIVLAEYVIVPDPAAPDFPRAAGYRIAAIADLNGDGRMEVVVADAAWEYVGSAVYEYDGTAFDIVLTSGCGV